MVAVTIQPQLLPCTPTYQNANVQDYILLTPTMASLFLYYYNDSASSYTLTISSVEPDVNGDHHSYVAPLSPNEETLIGGFDLTLYRPTISISSSSTLTGVTVAALYLNIPVPDVCIPTEPSVILTSVLQESNIELTG